MVEVSGRKTWEQFLSEPIARLEQFGLGLRTIRILENEFGLFVKDLQCRSVVDCRQLPQIGDTGVDQLRMALCGLLKRMEEGTSNGPG